MTVLASLALYATVVALVAPAWLTRAEWVRASPRLGVLAWQSCVLAVMGSVLLMSFSAFVPVERVSFDLGHLLHACAARLRSLYSLDTTALARGAALAVAGAALGRALWSLATHVRALRRARRRQRRFIALLGAPQPDGAALIDTDLAMAYSVPGGRGGRIVLTRGAVERLSPAGRAAVVAHERAHLSGRHDLVLLGAEVAADAFGVVPFFRHALVELRALVEMLADDAAARRTGASPLARALEDLGVAPSPPGALAVAQHATLNRILRLRAQRSRLTRRRAALTVLASFVVTATPWALAIAPALSARLGSCPVT